jgi:hypothetical protein
MTATATRSRKPKRAATTARDKAAAEIQAHIDFYRRAVHHAAIGRPVTADDAKRMESILDFLLLPEWAFARDVRACRRYLSMQEQAKQTSGEATEAIIDRAAELAFNHPHVLLPIELATSMRMKAREKRLARQTATRARLRSRWSTYR